MNEATDFVLVSRWTLGAGRARVWRALREPTQWPRWWRYVAAVDELDRGDAGGIGARHRFHWTSRLPYSIEFVMRTLEMREPEVIRARAEGDLDGEGCWRLSDAPGGTFAEYTWRVVLSKRWMRWFAPLLRPIFAWNHNAVMAAGEGGLRRYLREADAVHPMQARTR